MVTPNANLEKVIELEIQSERQRNERVQLFSDLNDRRQILFIHLSRSAFPSRVVDAVKYQGIPTWEVWWGKGREEMRALSCLRVQYVG